MNRVCFCSRQSYDAARLCTNMSQSKWALLGVDVWGPGWGATDARSWWFWRWSFGNGRIVGKEARTGLRVDDGGR